MFRTQYVVVEHDGFWKIRFDGKYYGQYYSRRDAVLAAIDAAYKVAQGIDTGARPPRFLAHSRLKNELQTEWTYGEDPYPPNL